LVFKMSSFRACIVPFFCLLDGNNDIVLPFLRAVESCNTALFLSPKGDRGEPMRIFRKRETFSEQEDQLQLRNGETTCLN
jgi:hypothetical protein